MLSFARSLLTSLMLGDLLNEAGIPEGTQIAHKHGWISGPSGIIQNISDAGIIFSLFPFAHSALWLGVLSFLLGGVAGVLALRIVGDLCFVIAGLVLAAIAATSMRRAGQTVPQNDPLD